MTYNPDIHHRHSIRLKEYDYSQVGAYFITICARQRECLFGDIVDGKMVLNDVGRVVESVWCRLPDYFTNINLDEFCVMPNHFHGILQIKELVGAKQDSPALPALCCTSGKGEARSGRAVAPTSPIGGTVSGSFCAIVQNFKSVSTRKINQYRKNPGCPVWQRNYYERIIRNENELDRALNNPLKWDLDHENPLNCQHHT